MTTDDNQADCPNSPIAMLVGEKITSVYFQGSVRLDIGLDPTYLLRIEGKCTLRRDGESHNVRGTPYDSAMEHLQATVGSRITTACAYEDGRLKLELDNGATITSVTDGEFEPWQIGGPNGFLIVSMPSGGLEVW